MDLFTHVVDGVKRLRRAPREFNLERGKRSDPTRHATDRPTLRAHDNRGRPEAPGITSSAHLIKSSALDRRSDRLLVCSHRRGLCVERRIERPVHRPSEVVDGSARVEDHPVAWACVLLFTF